MFDVDMFIELVKDKPCLWDKKLPEYSDRNCRERAWTTICEEFFEDWEVLDLKTKDAKGKDMKTKWRNLRDTFMRSVNTGKSGDPAPKRRKYVYLDKLSFLQNVKDKRQTSSNISGPSEPAEGTQDENSMDPILDGEEQTTRSANTTPLPSPASQKPTACYRKKVSLTTFQAELLKKLDKPPENEDNQDADKLFLMSLLPEVQAMHEDDKFDFRIKTLQLMRDLKRARSMVAGQSTVYYQSIPTSSSAPPHHGVSTYPPPHYQDLSSYQSTTPYQNQ